ncbi:MAG: Multimodular transpeptidase-transglycosylase [Candidatus Ozemobacter sibiricus]|uniref:peptidoglycan glycosyltransferase n=1 Tax=Candidatus Ozemobacter sibiricus TaxID=2268124 RepID=A0A367ZJL8_9BACT|nr:MAG: Multimodular transpeptidase-transglycosylase [Candidatus Ozemobacter sibiricus]
MGEPSGSAPPTQAAEAGRARRRAWGKRLALAALAGGVALWLLWRPLVWAVTPDVAAMVSESLRAVRGGALLDRHGAVLRFFPNAAGDYQLWVPLASCPVHLVQAVLAAEDRNFRQHSGFDVAAMARAAWQNLTERRIVSGASTITQQVVRMVRPRPRTWLTKLTELVLAAKLEMQLDKDRLLEAWLNLAPMYGNLRGVGMAARVLFRKGIEQVTVAEAATLAAFPQSPARLHPEAPKGRRLLLARRDWVLGQMVRLGWLSRDEERAARAAPMPMYGRRLPLRAPHFADWVVARDGPPRGEVMTSLDLAVQDRLVEALTAHRDRLARAGARQVAGLVADTATMEVLAMAGSFEYGPVGGGFNNGCLAPRSGGSILKPFLYALALEEGFHPGSIIPDTRRTFRTPQGDYLPYNATRRTYGPVSIRSALGNSLNISAVKMLNELGGRAFYRFLAGFGLVPPSDTLWEYYGLGLAIGNPEVRLVDVVAAYGAFAHGGRRVELRTTPGPLRAGPALMSEATAWSLLDIMSDPSARLLTFGNPRFFAFDQPVALKTGTSTNYRDCWIFAVTPAYVIGLWAGNFEGSATHGLGGATACGPILHQLLRDLPGPARGWFPRPAILEGVRICGLSGQAPTAFCPMVSREWVERSRLPLPSCPFHESQGLFHELPAEYADWIQQRGQALRVDPFRLQGDLAVADPLAALPDDSGAGVRVRPAGEASGLAAGDGPTGGASERIQRRRLGAAGAGSEGGGAAMAAEGEASRMWRAGAATEELGWGRIRIVSPHDGDRFVMVPDGDNLIRLRAEPETPLPEVIWLIDGAELARTPPPYEAWWRLERGRHTITALSLGEEAAQITIQVE